MSFKILEQNGVENEGSDGGALNNFCTGNRDGIIAGVLSECALAAAGNGVSISPGLLIICGVRIKITAAETFYLSSFPSSPAQYQIVVQVTLESSGDISAEIFLQSPSILRRDPIYAEGYGVYQAEIGSFTYNPDGSVSNLVRTLDTIYGAAGDGAANIEVGDVVTETLAAGLQAEFDVTLRREGNKSLFDFKAFIPQGANGKDGETGPQGDPGRDGAPGAQGEPGKAATIKIGKVTTGAAGTSASVTNVGTENDAVWDITIPQGANGKDGGTGPKGDPGSDGADGAPGVRGLGFYRSNLPFATDVTSIAWSTIATRPSDNTMRVGDVIVDTLGNAFVCTVQSTYSSSGNITVSYRMSLKGNTGETGADGKAATIAIGDVGVGTAQPGQPAAVVIKNVGTNTDAILDFAFMIPKGEQGDQGERGLTGNAATVKIGTVRTVSPSSPAAVINSGNSNYAILNFDIPQGIPGDPSDLLTLAYPINSIYMSTNSTDPGSLFGGSWTRISGRFLLGESENYEVKSTGGEATHTLTVNEMPSHSHTAPIKRADDEFEGAGLVDEMPLFINRCFVDSPPSGGFIGATGGGVAHNNMPPYYVVYIWRRIA